MRKLILLALLLLAAALPARAATFYFSWYADTASASTCKLIKSGKVFSDVTDVYTLTWNATDQIYQVALDDATFAPDYYRIEDGSGNIVVEQFYLTSKNHEGSRLDDIFVRNDGDDLKRGNLQIRPASGTSNVELLVDNNSTNLELYAQDTTGSGGTPLLLRASSVQLATISSSSAIALTGVAWNSATNSAVPKASVDSSRGAGWTWDSGNNTIMALRADLDALSGTGVFSANDSLFLTGSGTGGGIRINWAFDPAAVDDSVDFVIVYYGTTAIPAYSQSGATGLSSGTLSTIRANMQAIYPPRGSPSITIPVLENLYVIVVAFDHAAPTAQAWGSNQVLITGVPTAIDPSTPLVGTATTYGGAIATLAGEISTLQDALGTSGAGVKVLYCANFGGAAGAAPTEVVWYQAAAAATVRLYFTFYADAIFNTLRARWESSHDGVSKTGTFYIGSDAGTATKTVTHSATPDTWQNSELTQDLSALEAGIYQGSISIEDGSSSTSDTLFMRRLLIEQIHQ